MIRLLGHLWASPHTAFGLLLLLTRYCPRRIRWHEGCVEVVPRWGLVPNSLRGGFVTSAQTHGSIIFYANSFITSPVLRRHEQEHVRQCMRWGGVMYPLLYGIFFLYGICRGLPTLDAYRAIRFERLAREASYGR